MKRISVFLIAVILITGIVGCGEGDGTLVGPAGGTVVGSGGETVTIPPGALEEEQLIAISTIETDDLPLPLPDNTYLLGGVRLEPSVVFMKPVTVTIPLSASFGAGTALPAPHRNARPGRARRCPCLWRTRTVRTFPLLLDLHATLPFGHRAHGQASESEPQPVQDLWSVRPPDVLPGARGRAIPTPAKKEEEEGFVVRARAGRPDRTRREW